jgi:hemoglobin/transferrin/lactoferrin receptor protein
MHYNFKTIFITQLALFSLASLATKAQQNNTAPADTSKSTSLEEIVFSVNKTAETKRNTAQQIQAISAKEMAILQANTTADVLANTGTVFVQKSQMGGGSISIRGFEANRNILVIDGVRMNNLIYRGGHLQNIITTDNNSLERIEVLYGPASTIYGSDALGGVVHLYTKNAQLGNRYKNNYSTNFMTRFGSAANEITSHVDFNIGTEKFASFTSITGSRFGDLQSGKNPNPFYTTSYGERPFYVERINGKDSLVKNDNVYLQRQSGYSQYDILQKFLFQQNSRISHGINLQFSNSTDVPRYDRLTDITTTGLAFAEWYYGPQTRTLAAYDMNYKNQFSKIQNVHLGINFQDIIESRHTRRFGSNNLISRNEHVNIIGTNLDFQKSTDHHNLRFGLDAQYNLLTSTAINTQIVTGVESKASTRYPDGKNNMLNAALYASHTWKVNEKFTVVDGIRAGWSSLNSTFVDQSFYPLPYSSAVQNIPVLSGNLGAIYLPADDWKLSFLIGTGFRTPNVDDLSKVFDSQKGTVIVPNADIKPERTINYEVGVTKIFNKKIRWENAVYFTQFSNAIVTDVFQFNSQDSVLYDGVLSQVFANQNKRSAFVYGFSSNLNAQINKHWLLTYAMSYTIGRIRANAGTTPLDHIPPFMQRLAINYNKEKFNGNFFVNYNGTKKMKDYMLNGEDNEQYATPIGMPAWFTLNCRASYQLHRSITIQAGIDNILDTQYRTFSSGINASRRNFFGTVKLHL